MRKIYFTLGILLAGTIVMAYLYFSNLNIDKNANDVALRTITSNCPIVFSFENDKSFYEILSGQELIQQVLGEKKSKQLKNIADNLINNQVVFHAIEGQKTFIGFSSGISEVNFVIATQVKDELKPERMLKAIDPKKVTSKQRGKVVELTFQDSTKIFVGFKENLVLVSSSDLTLNSLLKATNGDESFISYIKENSVYNKTSLASLFINFKLMPALLSLIVQNKPTGELDIFNNQQAFAAFNYNFSKEKLLFTGNTSLNNPDSFYSLFSNVPAQQLTIANILPQKTANYTIYALENYASWQKNLKQWFAKNKVEEELARQLATMKERYRLDLAQVLPPYLSNEFVTFQLGTGEKFGAIALTNGEKVNQLLLDLSSEYASDIRIFKDSNIPFAFFGEPFKKFDRPFFTIIDNYLVMANNASSIQSFLSSYSGNRLLINEKDYIDLNNQISSSATIAFYVNRKNSNDIFGRNLKAPFYHQYQSRSGFAGYNAFCYQISGDKGKFLSNLILLKTQQKPALNEQNIEADQSN